MNRREPVLHRDRVRLLDLGGAEVRGADRPHRPRRDELVERAERLGDRRLAVRPVVPVDVDHVGAQPAEAVLDRLADVAARSARPLAVAHVHPELGRENDLVTPPVQHAPELLLTLAAAVDVGGVKEGDAGVERGVDDLPCVVKREPAAEVVAAEPDDRRRQAVAAERAGREWTHRASGNLTQPLA